MSSSSEPISNWMLAAAVQERSRAVTCVRAEPLVYRGDSRWAGIESSRRTQAASLGMRFEVDISITCVSCRTLGVMRDDEIITRVAGTGRKRSGKSGSARRRKTTCQ